MMLSGGIKREQYKGLTLHYLVLGFLQELGKNVGKNKVKKNMKTYI